MPIEWGANLRYSPVNGIAVPWRFDACCLAIPGAPEPEPVPGDPMCTTRPRVIAEPVQTYDWQRWIPEIVAGVENVPEDMAASFARRAAREFAIKGRVLRRDAAILLQHGVQRYPLEPFDGEQIRGVSLIESALGNCSCPETPTGLPLGLVALDMARNELIIKPQPGACGRHLGTSGPEWLLVRMWVAPTEDSCLHDVHLYETYREDITKGARAALFDEFHGYGSYKTNRGAPSARGDAYTFQRGYRLRSEFELAMRRARTEVSMLDAPRETPAMPIFQSHPGGPR